MSIMEKEEKNSRETGDKDDLAECYCLLDVQFVASEFGILGLVPNQ